MRLDVSEWLVQFLENTGDNDNGFSLYTIIDILSGGW